MGGGGVLDGVSWGRMRVTRGVPWVDERVEVT